MSAVRKLRTGRVGGPLGIKAKQLKAWLRAATREKEPNIETWDKVVSVIQVAFREGYILGVLICKTMVLILKDKG